MNKFLSAGIGIVFVGLVGYSIWSSLGGQGTSGGTMSMIPPDTSNIPIGDPIVQVKLPATLSPDAVIGKRAFEAYCSRCHGVNAAGRNGIGPPFIYSYYRPEHHGDMAWLIAPRRGVVQHHWRFGNMPPIPGPTDADLKMIVTYVRELQRANGIK